MKITDIDPKWPVAGVDGVIDNGRLTWRAGADTGSRAVHVFTSIPSLACLVRT
ncbi:hypothetical protein [Polaromonas sp. C04]|uniref:hypothetical protein n=1 Tax=Polaromonas sp. C04 TaxID=1945857 RepID=UPI0014390D57|nr:hypothetical protein [Polaromonas sp. C04]